MKIQHTVDTIVDKTSGAIVDTAAELFGPDGNGKFKECLVVSIANTDATDAMYVQIVSGNTANTLSTTVFDEKIPATESRQFQVERPNRLRPDKTQRIYILGAASPGTTYTATLFK